MTNFYDIIGKLLAAVLVALLAYLTPTVRAWLTANASRNDQEKIGQLVRAFVRAAEQLMRDNDPTGDRRNQFVREQLTALGVELTEAVLNMIESEVWTVNTETKKAQVRRKESGDGNG